MQLRVESVYEDSSRADITRLASPADAEAEYQHQRKLLTRDRSQASVVNVHYLSRAFFFLPRSRFLQQSALCGDRGSSSSTSSSSAAATVLNRTLTDHGGGCSRRVYLDLTGATATGDQVIGSLRILLPTNAASDQRLLDNGVADLSHQQRATYLDRRRRSTPSRANFPLVLSRPTTLRRLCPTSQSAVEDNNYSSPAANYYRAMHLRWAVSGAVFIGLRLQCECAIIPSTGGHQERPLQLGNRTTRPGTGLSTTA